jgi:hypothetical protein
MSGHQQGTESTAESAPMTRFEDEHQPCNTGLSIELYHLLEDMENAMMPSPYKNALCKKLRLRQWSLLLLPCELAAN